MDNNSISESLLQAIATMIGEGKQSVIECTIVSCDDPVAGEYTVNYQSNEFKVYGNPNSENIFTAGTNVHVIVPDGDFYKKKYILGVSASNQTVEEITDASIGNKYIYISNNFFQAQNEPFSLQSYHPGSAQTPLPGQEQKIDITDSLIPTGYSGLEQLKYYLLDGYKVFHLNFSAKTELDYDQTFSEGQYGIRLFIPFVGMTDPQVYEIKSNKMLGSAKSYKDWSTNYFKIEIDENLVYDDSRDITIEIFKDENFRIDKPAVNDIFLRNFSFYAVKYLSDSEISGYFLNINASGGNYFTSNSVPESSKTLTPELLANGIKIDNSKASYYWYEEDLRVNVNHIEYQPLAGAGWRCINTEKVPIKKEGTEEVIGYTYTPQETFIVHAGDILDSKKYKCATAYNGQRVSNTTTIVSHSDGYDFVLETADKQTAYLPDAGTITLVAKLHYAGVTVAGNENKIENKWLLYDRSGNELDSRKITIISTNEVQVIGGKSYFVSKASISSNIINDFLTIKCMSYTSQDIPVSLETTIPAGKSLGVRDLVLTYKEEEVDFNLYNLYLTDIDRSYQYDAQGYSPIISSYSGPLGCKVESITPIGFRIFTKEGVELEETQYMGCTCQWRISKNSLIIPEATGQEDPENPGYIIINSSGHSNFPYKIADYYDMSKRDNTVELSVTYDGFTMHAYAPLDIYKTGEQGTNGTSCRAYLTVKNFSASNKGYMYRQLDNVDGKDVERYLEFIALSGGDGYGYYYYYGGYNWFFKSIYDNKIYPFDQDDIIFEPVVYQDGRLLNSSEYSVKYQIVDNGYVKTYQNAFRIDKDSGRLDCLPDGELKSCIVEATIHVANWDLHCFYPLEVTVIEGTNIQTLPEIDFDTLLPRMTEEYDAVMYSSSGYDPRVNRNTTYFNYPFIEGMTYTSNTLTWEFPSSAFERIVDDPPLPETRAHIIPKDIKQSSIFEYYIGLSYEVASHPEDEYFIGGTIKHYLPILIYNNCYGLETLNAWDGTKLEINNDESYIFGAYSGWGTKDSANRLTGVLMGSIVDNSEGDPVVEHGLFALNKGEQTFRLDSTDGSLRIGKSGDGQIKILPNQSGSHAFIEGGNYNYDPSINPYTHKPRGTGMQIDLTEPSIKFGSGNFEVDREGNLKARNGDFKGKIEAESGNISGDLDVTGSLDVTGDITLKQGGNINVEDGGSIFMTDDSQYYVCIEDGEIILYTLCTSSTNGAVYNSEKGFYWNKRTQLNKRGLHVDNNYFNETLDASTSNNTSEPGYVGMAGVFDEDWEKQTTYNSSDRYPAGYRRGMVDVNADAIKMSHYKSNGTNFDQSTRYYDFRMGHFQQTPDIQNLISHFPFTRSGDDEPANVPEFPKEVAIIFQDPDSMDQNDPKKYSILMVDQLDFVKNTTDAQVASRLSPHRLICSSLDGQSYTIVNKNNFYKKEYLDSQSKLISYGKRKMEVGDDLEDGCIYVTYSDDAAGDYTDADELEW